MNLSCKVKDYRAHDDAARHSCSVLCEFVGLNASRGRVKAFVNVHMSVFINVC
jgi:hypothetical protein